MDIKDSYLHGTVGVVKSISVSADKLKYTLADIAGTVREVTLPVATQTANGLAPKVINTNKATVGSAYYVLASTNGSATPSWYKLPANAFANTTYTFANGTSGNFTVTPSGGTAQTISIGKPVTAGTADVAVKLHTKRKLWGLDFDGTADVSGNMTGVGNISMTGDLTILSGNTDKYITFDTEISEHTNSWRIGYLGTGSGNENYFVVQSTKTTPNTWISALTITNETLESIFAASVTAPTFKGKLDGTYVNKLTGYSKATSASNLAATDTLNAALGKLEYKASVAYDLVTKANDSDGTIENLKEILDVLAGIKDTETIKAIVGKYLPLAGGIMSGDINFKSIASWPTASGEKYPINSTGLSWNGSSDNAKIFYRVNASDDGLQIFLLGDDVNGDWIFEFTTGQTAATINKDGITAPAFYGKLSYTNLTGSGTTANQAIVSTGTSNSWTLKTLGNRAFDSTAYLPLTGGTITGTLTIKRAASLIKYIHTDDTVYGYIGFNAKDTPVVYMGDGSTVYKLIHSGNYTSYLPFLNSTSTHATNTSVIYAPTTAGTSGLVLTSNGSGTPKWSNSVGMANNGIFYIEGTGTTAGTWLGSHTGIASYYTGLTIAYKIPVAGAATTTLNINSLGAKTCYINTSKLTTHYGVGSVAILVYDGTYFRAADYWDGNSYAYVRQYTTDSTNSEYPLLFRYNTAAPTANGYVTEYTRYDSGITINPSTNTITATTFNGTATLIACTATTDNVTRPIVLTNTSSKLYYTTKATINYSTGNITAPTFTGNLSGNATTSTRSNYLETLKQDGSSWYGNQYKFYVLWGSSTILDLKCDGYFTRVNLAKTLDSATVISAKAFSLSNASWTDTGYTFASLASGTYAVQVTSGTNLVASGIMSVYKNLADSAGDEIPLHVYGTAGWRPYLRTYNNKLLISSNDASTTSRTVTIKIALIL